jgi:O6-methylguanine-DNA--protein-cysteine methyltransferase
MATVEARIKESGLSSVDDSPWLSKLPSVEGMVNISSAAAAQRKEKQRQSSGDELSSQDLLNLTSKKQSMERLSQKVVFGSTIAYPQLAELKGANRQPSRLSLAVAAAAQHRLSAS